MTDPQLPPPSPHGSVPPVPSAPASVPPQEGFSTPSGLPAYQDPPGAYTAPVGGYSEPGGPYQPPQNITQASSSALGIIAFVLSIIAGVIASIIGGITAYEIGFRRPSVFDGLLSDSSDLSFLSPVRDQVLFGELSFWAGTIAGIAALVLGIMAIVKRRGRIWGIVAVIIAALGPVIFMTVVTFSLSLGTAAGTVPLLGAG